MASLRRERVVGMMPVAVFILLVLLCQTSGSHATLRRMKSPFHFSGPQERAIDFKQWKKLGKPDPMTVIPLTFALKQRNVDVLESLFYNVSNPRHPHYGRHLTIDQITELVHTPKETAEHVVGFLRNIGVTKYRFIGNGDYIQAHVPVGDAEEMFSTEFYKYQHEQLGIEYVRAEKPYETPVELLGHVFHILGGEAIPSVDLFKDEHHNEEQVSQEVGASNASQSDHSPSSYSDVMAPIAWRGSNVTVLAAVRCADGSLVTKGDQGCSDPSIKQIHASVIPLAAKFRKSKVSFDWKNNRFCRTCSEHSEAGYFRGRKVEDVCNLMLSMAKMPADAIICKITIPDVVVGTKSSINVEVEYDNGEQSAEARCVENAHSFNCSKVFTAMPDATPPLLREVYNIPADLSVEAQGNKQAVASFLNEYVTEKDVNSYFNRFGAPDSELMVVGPNDDSKPGSEAELDVEVIMSMAPNAPTFVFSNPGLRRINEGKSAGNQEPFLKWMLEMNSLENPPPVISVSYDDDLDFLPESFIRRVDVEFMKAGLRGISLLFAAGDDGTGGTTIRDGGEAACKHFFPEWPASSPYVTAVGGTMLQRPDPKAEGPLEEVVSDVAGGSVITTGGGFSSLHSRPWYQEKFVKHYLENHKQPPSKYFDATGRGYPDVSGLATNFLIELSPQGLAPIGGTSATTPLLSAMVTLWNDVRMKNNRPTLGFLNPLIYALAEDHPDAFNDVKHGNNKCSALPDKCCPYGFEAQTGWDATSGVGTPNFSKIRDLVSTLGAEMTSGQHASLQGGNDVLRVRSPSFVDTMAVKAPGDAQSGMWLLPFTIVACCSMLLVGARQFSRHWKRRHYTVVA